MISYLVFSVHTLAEEKNDRVQLGCQPATTDQCGWLRNRNCSCNIFRIPRDTSYVLLCIGRIKAHGLCC